jgi:UDP:flavonoid glycosyltransferase YjiC (YdhE family)
MPRILFLAFSGGGNLPPSLGIARELTARGHEVVFAGEPEMMPRMKSAPFRAIELTQAYAQLDKYPDHPQFGRWFCGLTSPAVEAQARSIVEAISFWSTSCFSPPKICGSASRAPPWLTWPFFASPTCFGA